MLRDYQFSQKLKLLGNGEFNHLTNILTLSLTCGPRLPLNDWGPTRGIFNFLNGGSVELRFELGITCSDTMRNYQFSQKLKLLGNGEFNRLTNILTCVPSSNSTCLMISVYFLIKRVWLMSDTDRTYNLRKKEEIARK